MIRYLPVTGLAAAFLMGACVGAPETLPLEVQPIPARMETAPMTGVGDRADDPALWVHPTDPAQSLILGTNKEEGLHVYDLSGTERQFLDVGRVNNVDVRGNLAAASNDEFNATTLFAIDPDTGAVSQVANIPTGKDEPYGICMGTLSGKILIMPTYKDGSVQIWAGAPETTDFVLTRSVQVGAGQLEGCVIDDEAGIAFIGEEEHGIWKLDLTALDSHPEIVDRISDGNGLVADTEGLSLWIGKDGAGCLVASAQAADRFVVYDRAAPHTPRGIVTITASLDGQVDAVTHTDGLDVSSADLPGFPHGVMIVQDDANPASELDQNFKLVDWADIEAALGLVE